MACGTATLKMSTFDDAATAWERREQISSAIEKTYVPKYGLSQSLDIHTNSKEMHPVDLLTRVVESEGIRQLLMMTKKKELQKMCEHAALDADPNDKRQMIKLILQTWTDIGTKKFLKKSERRSNFHNLQKFRSSCNSPYQRFRVFFFLKKRVRGTNYPTNTHNWSGKFLQKSGRRRCEKYFGEHLQKSAVGQTSNSREKKRGLPRGKSAFWGKVWHKFHVTFFLT